MKNKYCKTLIFAIFILLISAFSVCFTACGLFDFGSDAEKETVHKHTLVHYTAHSATCTADGNVEYWQCSDCNKCFDNSEGTNEITDVTVPAAHNYVQGVCVVCSELKPSEGLVFELNSQNGTYKVKGAGTCTDAKVVIPSTYQKAPVVCIGAAAFNNCTTVTSVIIPNSVLKVESSAFKGCNNLAEISIGSGMREIGDSAFRDCTNLSTVKFPNNSQLDIIWQYAFEGCKNLVSFAVPSGVTRIADGVFFGCAGLTSIAIPASVNDVGSALFKDCTALVSVTLPEGITEISTQMFSGCASLTSIAVPSSVTSVNDYAFYGCRALSGIVMPSGVTSVGDYAFAHCNALTAVTVPAALSRMGNFAYCECNALTKVNYLGTVDGWCAVEFGNMYANPLYYANDLYIGGVQKESLEITSATKINKHAFINCSVSSITVGGSVTEISEGAFSGCGNLTSVVLPFVGAKRVTESDRNQYPFGYIFGTRNYAGATLTSQRYHGSESSVATGNYYIPASLTTVSVNGCTYLPYGAFYGCEKLVSVTLDNAVCGVGKYAFYGCRFASITLPENLNSINEHTFEGCVNLNSLTLPSSVTEIGQCAFRGCVNLKEVVFASDGNLASVAREAFYGCTGLRSVVLPEGLTDINMYAFANCKNLHSITLPATLQNIGVYAFNGCRALVDVCNLSSLNIVKGTENYGEVALHAFDVHDGGTDSKLTTDENGYLIYTDGKDVILLGYTGTEVDLTLPSGITAINGYAFEGCNAVTSVVLPSGVVSIGSHAFENCSALVSINLPYGITDIGKNAFYYCVALASVTIPESVTTLDEYVFAYCTGLTSVTIPAALTYMGCDAFCDCVSLNCVNYLGSVDSWCETSFYNEDASPLHYAGKLYAKGTLVSDVTITSEKINSFAFSGCSSLTSVMLSKTVTDISSGAFAGCANLASITVDTENTVYHSTDNCLIYTKDKRLIAGVANSTIPADGSVTEIGWHAFDGCTKLVGVTIPDCVTQIGRYAFSGCTNLSYVNFGRGSALAEIDAYAFDVCTSLASIKIPCGVSVISAYAFRDCSSLAGVTFLSENTITEIGICAFENCVNLTAFTIPQNVAEIGSYAFAGCKGLASVRIPYETQTIGANAFDGCSSLASVSFAAGCRLSDLGDEVFANCISLTAIAIPDSVRGIGYSTFENCYSLATVTLPSSVTYIRSKAFSGCRNLAEIAVPWGVSKIESRSFENCYSLARVTLPAGIKSMENYAFQGCVSLSGVNYLGSVDSWCEITFDALSNPIGGGCNLYINGVLLTNANITSARVINSYAFYGCSTLVSVTIPSCMVNIGANAFNCVRLVEVRNASSLAITAGSSDCGGVARYALTVTGAQSGSKVHIDAEGYAVYNGGGESVLVAYLGNATTLSLPAGITRINPYAFYQCKQIVSVTIPYTVKEICDNAFDSPRLAEVCNHSDLAIKAGVGGYGQVASYALNVYSDAGASKLSTDKNGYITYTDGDDVILVGYTGTEKSLIVPNGVTKINDSAFSGCGWVNSVTIPASVTTMGSGAFDRCYNITKVNYLGTIDGWCEIYFQSYTANPLANGARLYINDEQVRAVRITSAKIINSMAFFGCKGLVDVTIEDSVTEIGFNAFYNCSDLTYVRIAPSVKKVGRSAFYGCNKLQYRIYTNALYLGDERNPYQVLVSAEDDEITYCTVNADTVVIAGDAFSSCSKLTSFRLQDGSALETIGDAAFWYCTGVSSITLAGSLSNIGEHAFGNCSALENVTFLGTKTQWEEVVKGYEWSVQSALTTVYCTDGEIYLK